MTSDTSAANALDTITRITPNICAAISDEVRRRRAGERLLGARPESPYAGCPAHLIAHKWWQGDRLETVILLAAAVPPAVAALPELLDLFCRVYCQSGYGYQRWNASLRLGSHAGRS